MHLDGIPQDGLFGESYFVKDFPHGGSAAFFEWTARVP